MGWLDECNIPLLCYSARLRDATHRPNMLFVECTPGLDTLFMEKLAKRKVSFSQTKTSPELVGLPIGGDRLWAASAQDGVRFGQHPLNQTLLSKLAHRPCTSKPHSFFTATKQEILHYHEHTCSLGLTQHPRGRHYSWRNYLNPGAEVRLCQHERHVAQVRRQAHYSEFHMDPDFLLKVMGSQVFDISQNIDHHSFPRGIIPRPLCSSTMYSEALSVCSSIRTMDGPRLVF